MFAALFGRRANRRDFFRHFPAHLVLHDFRQCDIGQPHAGRAHSPADAADRRRQHVSWRTRREIRLTSTLGLPTFSTGPFTEFRIH